MDFFRYFSKQKLLFLPTSKLVSDPGHHRCDFDKKEQERLCQSIKELGILQPLAVKKKKGTDKYLVVCGERRRRAASSIGLKKLPCIVLTDKRKSSVLSFAENFVRKDLSCFEESDALLDILRHGKPEKDRLLELMCVSEKYLADRLELQKLDMRERLISMSNGIPDDRVRELAGIGPASLRASLMLEFLRKKLDTKTAELLISQFRNKAELKMKKLPSKCKYIQKSEKAETITKKCVMYDLGLFFNTVRRAVDFLEEAGINATWEKQENENETVVTVCIKKRAVTLDVCP